MIRLRTSRPWQAITSRPHLPIAIYLAVVGWATLLSSDRGTHGLLIPDWLAAMWAAAVAVGGTLATFGGLTLRTRLESAGLVLLTYGASLYGAVFGVKLWPSWTPVALAAAVACMCLIRLRVLHQARRAEKVAATIRRNGG